MRDAFGGVFMIRLLLVFMFIYITFTAVSLNYAKAFRIKNKLIDLVEQEEILDLKTYYSKGNGSGLSKIDKILASANYHKECRNGNGVLKDDTNASYAICYNGIIISVNENTSKYITYNIYTYADWNLGPLNMILSLGGKKQDSEDIVDGTWEISGEAKVLKRNTKK